MKKLIILLGVFTLLVVTPSFAQEKSVENSKTATVKPVTIEKKKVTATKKVAKAQNVQNHESKTVKLKKAQEIKSVEPKVIKEEK